MGMPVAVVIAHLGQRERNTRAVAAPQVVLVVVVVVVVVVVAAAVAAAVAAMAAVVAVGVVGCAWNKRNLEQAGGATNDHHTQKADRGSTAARGY